MESNMIIAPYFLLIKDYTVREMKKKASNQCIITYYRNFNNITINKV